MKCVTVKHLRGKIEINFLDKCRLLIIKGTTALLTLQCSGERIHPPVTKAISDILLKRNLNSLSLCVSLSFLLTESSL